MSAFICVTCGVQHAESDAPPQRCAICEDQRQYVGSDGQQWTTAEDLRTGHRNTIREEEPGVWSIVTEPNFGIGQRAYLVRTESGNVLWDCVSLLDDATLDWIREHGGLRAIAISHPHYYATMVEWSRAFDVPVWLHEADREWVMRPDPAVRFWSGETHAFSDGTTLVRSGGHFDGFQVLHWPSGAAGRGVLFAGDQPQVCMDRRWVTFLYSYPNMIPLGPSAVRRVVASLEPFEYDRIYGAFGRNVLSDAKGAVRRSAERYLRFLAE